MLSGMLTSAGGVRQSAASGSAASRVFPERAGPSSVGRENLGETLDALVHSTRRSSASAGQGFEEKHGATGAAS